MQAAAASSMALLGDGPADRVTGQLKDLELAQPGATTAELGALFEVLRAAYDAQERAAAVDDTVDQMDEEFRTACKSASLLFVTRGLLSMEGTSAVTRLPINKIVAAYNINLLDFFREVTVVISRLSPVLESRGTSAQQFTQATQLKENAETVVVLGLLAKKYKDYFNQFLHQLDMYKQVALRMGWAAFLLLKSKLLSAFPDVVSCLELLPCIFALLVSSAPRLPDNLSGGQVVKPSSRPDLLKAISDVCKADHSRVQARMPSVQAFMAQLFTSAVPDWRRPSGGGGDDAAVAEGGKPALPVFEGLMTDIERMNCVVAALEREYEAHYTRASLELDERDFLSTDFSKFASPRCSPGAMHSAFSKLRNSPGGMVRSGGMLGPGAHMAAPSQPLQQLPLGGMLVGLAGLHSPLPIMNLTAAAGGPPSTPLTELLGAAAWLRGITSNLAAEPTAVVQRHLLAMPAAAGATPPAALLSRRVREMVAAVIPDDHTPSSSLLSPFPLLQPSLAAERRTEAVKLYYYSLDSIVAAEDKAGGQAAVAALLASTKFHRGLVACCVEVVAACYRMVSCAFPKVLDGLRLKAFDLSKMIHSFVRSVATLPRDLKRHLFLIEEKIIESLAWEAGSSLYHLILHSQEHQQQQQQQQAAQQQLQLAAAATGALPQSQAQQASQLQQAPSLQAHASLTQPSASQDGGSSNSGEGRPSQAPETQEQPGVATQQSKAQDTPLGEGAGPMDTEQLATQQSQTSMLPPPLPAATSTASGQPAPPAHVPPPSPKRGQAAAFSEMMSPAKRARGAEGSAMATQPFSEPLPQAVGALPGEAGGALPGGQAGVLHEFLRKVLKLSSFRLTVLCEHFDFSPLDKADVVAKVYSTIEHAVYHQTHLFYNRHIDQVMLSALYGYCKVHKLHQVSFREIIASYRKQPQSQQPVFRSVIIEQTNPGLQVTQRADIIAFYNQAFVPSMKAFLLKADASSSAAPASHVGGGPSTGLPPLPPPRNTRASPRAARSSGSARAASGRVASALNGDTAGGAGASGSTPNTPSGSGQVAAAGAGGSALPLLPRPARGKSAEHKIPGGLAALLQALDSQQGARPPAPGAAAAEAAGAAAAAADAQQGPVDADADPPSRSGSHEGTGNSASATSRDSPTRLNSSAARGNGATAPHLQRAGSGMLPIARASARQGHKG